jgi:hypothetical protein
MNFGFRDGILETTIKPKTRVFCSMLFTVPSTGGFLKKTILFSCFKQCLQKIRETSKLESIYE